MTLKIKNIIKLIVSIAIPILIGMAGSIFTMMGMDGWYSSINKPVFNPPSWIFAPVWTGLFILMGCAFYFIWVSNGNPNLKRKAVFVYFVQLAFNFLWSVLFFGLKNPLLALIGIIILIMLICLNIYYFCKVYKPAGLIMIPYILWVSFATVLNLTIVLIN